MLAEAHARCVCPFSGKKQEFLLLCPISTGQHAPWEKACLCSCGPFHAHSYIPCIKGWVAFKDLGAEYYNQFNKERKIKAYLKKLKALGWDSSSVMVGQPA